jgi:hypothetical protein
VPSHNISIFSSINLYMLQRKLFPHIGGKVPVNMGPELSLNHIWETNDS